MNIIGHGIDIVEIQQLEIIMNRSGERFVEQYLTTTERGIAESHVNQIQYLAGRLAAKEAVLKALGTGWSCGFSFLDIEIYRLATGQPSVMLHAKCKELAEECGITGWHITISHTKAYAAASVIAVG